MKKVFFVWATCCLILFSTLSARAEKKPLYSDISLVEYAYECRTSDTGSYIRHNSQVPVYVPHIVRSEGGTSLIYSRLPEEFHQTVAESSERGLTSLLAGSEYEIYRIKFQDKSSAYDYYLFIDPESSLPVLEYNIFGLAF